MGGTLAGAIIPELVKVFTSTESAHVREVVSSSREGGPSLNILSGLVAGNFSAFWLGICILVLMGIAYGVSLFGLGDVMIAPAVRQRREQIAQQIADVNVRSHTFKFIPPSETEILKVPNGCNSCHTDKSTEWAKEELSKWPNVSPWRVAQ